jgi:hypothetical protein
VTLRRPICALPERHTDDAGDQTDDQQPARRGEQQFDFAVQLRIEQSASAPCCNAPHSATQSSA